MSGDYPRSAESVQKPAPNAHKITNCNYNRPSGRAWRMRILIAISLTLACLCARAEDISVPRFRQREPWAEYIVEILTTALSKAPGATPDRFHWVETRMNQDRAFAMLRSSRDMDVFWSMTS